MVILIAGCLGLFLFSKQIKIDNQNDPVRNYVGQSKEIIQSQLNEKTEAKNIKLKVIFIKISRVVRIEELILCLRVFVWCSC